MNTWYDFLKEELESDEFKALIRNVKNEYNNKIIYPKYKDIFKAFKLCNIDDVKVVIIGQDPYHGENEATGLAFSVEDNIKTPPSLRNIFIELNDDLKINKTNNENWKLNYNNKEKIIIYPVQTKKSYTLDLPYSEMFRQFNDVINKTNSTLFIMGYSFSDEHINDIIENSLSNPFINIVLFLYSNKEECIKNEYLNKLITRAYIDSRLTIFFGDTLSDFENIVSDILPIEAEKNPYREVIKQLEELVRTKNGDEE